MKNFNFRIIDMLQYIPVLHTFILRDFDEFSKYGIKDDDIVNFIEKVNQLNSLLTKSSVFEFKLNAKYNKNDIRIGIINQLKIILLKIEIKYKYSDRLFFDSIHIKNLSTKKDLLLFDSGKKLIAYGKEHINRLNEANISLDDLIEVENKLNLLWEVLNHNNSSRNNKKARTAQIKTLSKEVYTIMSDFCKIGKLIWKQKGSYAHYNDYLIYKNVNSGKKKTKKTSEPEKFEAM